MSEENVDTAPAPPPAAAPAPAPEPEGIAPEILAQLRQMHGTIYTFQNRGLWFAFRVPPESFFYEAQDIMNASRMGLGTKGMSAAMANIAASSVVFPANAPEIFSRHLGMSSNLGLQLYAEASTAVAEIEKKGKPSGR